jgi:signal peptidase II
LGRRALTRIRAIAATSAGLALLLDLLIEHMLVAVKDSVVLIPGLLDFARTWNRGVSFGLLWQNGDTGRYVLIAALAVVAVGVGILAWRATNRLAAMGYGLIVGGALGNLVGRAMHGAVFDYLFLHLGRMPLFVCNFPDIAISAGVILLIAESLLTKQETLADS